MVSDSELNFKEHITVTLCNTATICNSFVTHFVTIIRWTGIQDADLQLKTRELESEAQGIKVIKHIPDVLAQAGIEWCRNGRFNILKNSSIHFAQVNTY